MIDELEFSINIAPEVSSNYIDMRDTLLDDVNSSMSNHPEISFLIGGNPIAMMMDNHSNHIDFMATIFQYNSYEMLVKTIPWVYRAYSGHGFSFDYFPVELECWKKAIKRHLEPTASEQINIIYDWMIKNHNKMIELSSVPTKEEDTYPELDDQRMLFTEYIIQGDFQKCMKIAEDILNMENGQEILYMGIIQPVMYQIGLLWEADKISTAEEHLATSIVSRIMAGLYAKLPTQTYDKGKGVVTSAPNEFHELGGRILADTLESAGWDIYFLGANTPVNDLHRLLEKINPNFLAISVAMPYNIDKLAAIISTIKVTPKLNHIKILVGGLAFNTDLDLWKKIGADAWAKDPQSALEKIAKW